MSDPDDSDDNVDMAQVARLGLWAARDDLSWTACRTFIIVVIIVAIVVSITAVVIIFISVIINDDQPPKSSTILIGVNNENVVNDEKFNIDVDDDAESSMV